MLVSCKECGHRISSDCDMCVKCGSPMKGKQFLKFKESIGFFGNVTIAIIKFVLWMLMFGILILLIADGL